MGQKKYVMILLINFSSKNVLGSDFPGISHQKRDSEFLKIDENYSTFDIENGEFYTILWKIDSFSRSGFGRMAGKSYF